IGIIYPNPNQVYTRTRDLSQVRQGFEQQLKGFETDYSDFGMLHYVDAADDLEKILSNGIFDYARKLKQDGTVRHLGISTHSVNICQQVLKINEIDLIMLSTNTAYDFEPSNGKLIISQERRQLYQDCQKSGVAITVMKPFGGGRLLDASTSPFHRAMSIPQCIQYALDRPAAITCVPGVRSMDDLTSVLAYYNAPREERDYSSIADAKLQDIDGVCIYCNHCLPCPVSIDIGAVNKYLDLANSGDELAKDHYFKLTRKASDCTFCGVCEPRCPFHVHVRARMEEAIKFFGK
ncbi:MAG: aldo/keto reductase, partial [Bacillota bacterium]|nr:aldo/keto reductase [Bacillota bacterium]